MTFFRIGTAALLLGLACGCQQGSAMASDHAADAAPATKPMREPVAKPTQAPRTGSISGHIQYPSESIPEMHVCAIATADTHRAGCVRTQRDQAEYRIDGLAPGDYAVYGWFNEGDMHVIRARQTIMCIRAPCPPGEPIVVTLAPGEHYIRAHLNDAAEVFPGMPAEPSTD